MLLLLGMPPKLILFGFRNLDSHFEVLTGCQVQELLHLVALAASFWTTEWLDDQIFRIFFNMFGAQEATTFPKVYG